MLDLFAGSGALGFEALSRGARHVTFVEEHRPTVKLIEKNVTTLRVEDRSTVLSASVDALAKRTLVLRQAPFDLILADPPYAAGWELRLLNELDWENLLAPDGFFCIEWGTQKSQVAELPDQIPGSGSPWLVKVREKNYGDSVLTTYRRAS